TPAAGGAAGSGGSGEEAEKALRTLVGLLRLREDEVTVRQQTALLDADRQNSTYAPAAEELHARHQHMLIDLHSIQADNPIEQISPPLTEANDLMQGVSGFLK